MGGYLKALSKNEAKRYQKFKEDKSAKAYLLGKYLTKKIIAFYTKKEINEIKLNITKFGKPYLKYPKIKNLEFNLSHSGDWIVFAISHEKIGIDIEKIRPIDTKIAEDYFTEQEIISLSKNKIKKLENFYKLWTLKESYVKALGKGLSIKLKSFYFEYGKNNIINLIPNHKRKKWNFYQYNLEKKYIVSICIDIICPPKKIDIIDILFI